MMDPFAVVGHPLTARFSRLISFGAFLYQIADAAMRHWRRAISVQWQITSFQIYFTCIQALPLIFFLSLFVVAVFISQADTIIENAEATKWVANLFVVVVIRELAPLLTTLVVVGRSGTAIASELASMTANEEIDALRVMGVDPIHHLVIPRVIGITVSVVCLSLTFSLVSLFFTMVIGFYDAGVSPISLLQGVTQFISILDIFLNLVKSLFFGMFVALISCFWGLSARGSKTEIPQVTTKAVIASMFWCFVFSALITMLVY